MEPEQIDPRVWLTDGVPTPELERRLRAARTNHFKAATPDSIHTDPFPCLSCGMVPTLIQEILYWRSWQRSRYPEVNEDAAALHEELEDWKQSFRVMMECVEVWQQAAAKMAAKLRASREAPHEHRFYSDPGVAELDGVSNVKEVCLQHRCPPVFFPPTQYCPLRHAHTPDCPGFFHG